MSSSNLKTARNGDEAVATVEGKVRDHGLVKLRQSEAKGLISLASDAASETFALVHDMHKVLYDRENTTSDAELQRVLEEALTCFQVTDHYLRMLGSVLEERSGSGLWPPREPPF
jgi:hypothetical protein